MLADQGVGEWGFSALVEADGRRILFDTGNRPETVLQNARELGIDLSTVTDVVLSHHHADHTGGLLVLRQELARKSPAALSRIHVAPGIFLSRRHPGSEEEANPTIAIKSPMEASGAVFLEHRTPVEIFPGIWVSGPVPRPNPERFWGTPTSIVTKQGLVADSIPEDMALIINTDRGFVLVAGCGHAGTINTVEYARRIVGPEPVYALIGGLHLFAASDSAVAWTADRLRADHLGYLLGAHCTGIEAVFRIRELAALIASEPWWPRWDLPSMRTRASIPCSSPSNLLCRPSDPPTVRRSPTATYPPASGRRPEFRGGTDRCPASGPAPGGAP